RRTAWFAWRGRRRLNGEEREPVKSDSDPVSLSWHERTAGTNFDPDYGLRETSWPARMAVASLLGAIALLPCWYLRFHGAPFIIAFLSLALAIFVIASVSLISGWRGGYRQRFVAIFAMVLALANAFP